MKNNIKLFIWFCFVLITCGMLAWPVAKWMKKGKPQEIFVTPETVKAFDSGQDDSAPAAGPENTLKPIDTALTRDLAGGGERRQPAQGNVMPSFASLRERQTAAERGTEKAEDASEGYFRDRTSGAKREKEFIRKHAREIRKYQDQLGKIGQKHWKKSAALRRMDADFAKMDRYMALNRQYAKDRNAFNWARGVLALPEVRAAVIRYSSDPEAVQALVEVGLEAAKTAPPPQALLSELQHFMSSDEKTSRQVNDVLVQSIGNAMGTLAAIPAQKLAPLQKLGGKIMGTDLAKSMGGYQP